MASSTKRSWKLQDFVAHTSNVNCLALGHKSGRVLVTGGDDRKVNLWAVGKHNCIMEPNIIPIPLPAWTILYKPRNIRSLSGHATAIECVRFGQTEDLVCAGSQTGVLKIWDLEHAKLARTLTGHGNGIKCMDFHPYGELLTSGSLDKAIKLWDMRRKGCIFTYKGHTDTVNCLKFSPDGQWIASAGAEGIVKLWDLRAGKQLREFSEHRGPVTTVEFHPHEFLLASGSTDHTVHFWDLESFQLVSSTDQMQSTAIRSLYFSQGGECLFAGSQDTLKVYGWEPTRTLDTVPTGWGKVQDIAVAQNQLIGASFHIANVLLFVCDLKKVAPFGGISSPGSPFSHGNSLRKSFSKERPPELKKHKLDVKTIEEADKSGTDPEDDVMLAEIPNVTDYRDVFQPNRSLSRTPPPEIEAFIEPEEMDPTKPQILKTLSTSMSNLRSNDESDDDRPSIMKPIPVRVNPIKSSPPVQRNITPTSQIRANLQANINVNINNANQNANANVKNSRNIISSNSSSSAVATSSSIPPLRQSITPLLGKKNFSTGNNQQQQQQQLPLGPQRSNSTLTPRVAPMAAISPVMDDGKIKNNRATSPDSTKLNCFKRQTSCKNGEHGYESDYPIQINNIRHSPSDPALNRPNTAQSRSTSLQRNFANSTPLSARNVVVKKQNKAQVQPNVKVDIRVSQLRPTTTPTSPQPSQTADDKVKDVFVPMIADKPSGLDVDEFLPDSYRGRALGYSQLGVLPEMSEAEVLNTMMRGYESMMTVLNSRHRSLQIIYSLWHSKDLKAAVDSAVAMNDLSVIVDLLGVITLKPTIWNLDLCNSLLTSIGDLLQSKYEMYVSVGCTALRLILRNFSPVIKSNVQAPLHTIGVDVSREERYHKCVSCYDKLMSVRSLLMKKQDMTGKIGATFRELGSLMEQALE